jgi:hypothetical protein
LRGYFVLIFPFKSLKIGTLMRLLKPKLSTKPLSQKPQLISLAFLVDISKNKKIVC